MLGGAEKVKAGIGNDYLLIQTATWFTPEKGDVGIFDLGGGKDKLEINAWNHDIDFVDGKSILLDGELIAKVSNWESLRYNASSFATEFIGTDKDEEVNCQLGDDVISTMGGNDFVHGHGGDDTLDGGTGNDTAAYWYNFSKSVEVTLNGSKFVNVMVGGVVEDKIRNFENLIGGQLGDELSGDKNKNTLDGAAAMTC